MAGFNELTAGRAKVGDLAFEAIPDVDGLTAVKEVRATFDFAKLGGAIGSIALPVTLPEGAIVMDGMVHVLTAVTSGGAATVALQLEAAGDIVAAAAVTGAPWSTTGLKDIVPAGTAATAVKTTVARKPTVVIATAALTAGKFRVFLRYVTSE